MTGTHFDERELRWRPPDEGPPRDLVGYGAHPPTVSWPDQARVALSLVVNIEEGSERSFAFGDNYNEPNWESHRAFPPEYRDLTTESVFEYGSRAGIHRVFRILREMDVQCTTFACAVALAVNPDVVSQIREGRHEVCSHGWRWTELWTLTASEEREHIARASALLEQVTGQRPLGWYSRYGPSINTRKLLREAGFLYDSDAYNDDLPYYASGPATQKPYIVIPYTMTYNDGKFADSYASPDDFLTYMKRGLNCLLREGSSTPKMMSIGLHPRIIGQAARADALQEFIGYAKAQEGVWFARRDEIAHLWLEKYPNASVTKDVSCSS